MTATITAAEKVTGWALDAVDVDPFGNIPDSDADRLAAEFAAIPAPAAEVVEEVAEPAQPVVTCAGCGRPLRAAKSRTLGRGPVCQRRFAAAVKAESAGYTPAQAQKALDAFADDAVIRVGHLYLVVSSDGSTRYETAPTGECSCTAAMYGRRCWHVLAVRIAERAGLVATDPDTVGFAPLAGEHDDDSHSIDPIDL